MLSELRIENFAIIDHLELSFERGLIIFTGETGAGKSILIDAVEMLLGERADSTLVRSQSDYALVEGIFNLTENVQGPVNEILEREGLLDDPQYLALGREIRTNGRNVARVNGRTVSAGVLKEISEFLVDVHGQSEHLSLLKVNQHLRLLDEYAGLGKYLKEYRGYYYNLLEVRQELSALRKSESDAAREIDTLNYQINEIEAAQLGIGEDEALREERTRLSNAEGLAVQSQAAFRILDEGSADVPSTSDLLGQAVDYIKNLARIDPSQSTLFDQANVLYNNLSDIASELRRYFETLEHNPRRLDQVEERLGLIHDLKRKYGKTIHDVLIYAEEARKRRETVSNAGERINELERLETQLLQQVGLQGEALSNERQSQAEKLSALVETELRELGMENAHFRVDFTRQIDSNGVPSKTGERVAFDANGVEKVEFMIAPNPGEGFKPLVKIASGGETSRLMLALKHVLISADQIPTLIFDEIDQGVGGRIGAVVGHKLDKLGKHHQVFCVTHLPQLAVYGGQHLSVQKEIVDGRTVTVVKALTGDERLTEIAQMYGDVSEATIHSARELLRIVTRAADIPSL
jgi:DNA repair protein RecN (Recombination protein N)